MAAATQLLEELSKGGPELQMLLYLYNILQQQPQALGHTLSCGISDWALMQAKQWAVGNMGGRIQAYGRRLTIRRELTRLCTLYTGWCGNVARINKFTCGLMQYEMKCRC